MENPIIISDAFSCHAKSTTNNGWLAVASVYRDYDKLYLEKLDRDNFILKKGKSQKEWRKTANQKWSELVLVKHSGKEFFEQSIPSPIQINSFSIVDSERNMIVCCGKSERKYTLSFFDGNLFSEILISDFPICNPSSFFIKEEIFIIVEICKSGKESCQGITLEEKILFEIPGRNPKTMKVLEEKIWIVVEIPDNKGCVYCELYEFDGEKISFKSKVPSGFERNFNAGMAFDSKNNLLYLILECSPAWGFNELQGQFRELSLWQFNINNKKWLPADGTENSVLPIPRRAFWDTYSEMNYSPVNPRIYLVNSLPVITYREFRFEGQKGFGWDVYALAFNEDQWSSPVRLTKNKGPMDTNYELIFHEENITGFFPCCDHLCMLSFEEETCRKEIRSSLPAENHRVEIVTFKLEEFLRTFECPLRHRRNHALPPPSILNIAPKPLPLKNNKGKTLIWGDIHAHSAYSKCMAAVDGSPLEVLKMQKEILGSKVLCLTEHVEFISSSEFNYIMDILEAEAGNDFIPLYGVECVKPPAHHVNFYAIDRNVFNNLRTILVSSSNMKEIFNRIKLEFPADSVLAIRHMHGMDIDKFGKNSSMEAETFDARIEKAMESMQTRGNMLVPRVDSQQFPANFINAGVKIGLVAGSDHSRGMGPNKYCLTGFWVDDLTPASVFKAICERKTIGVSNGKIAVWLDCGGKEMGDSVTLNNSDKFSVKALISSACPLLRVCLVRNSKFLDWRKLEGNYAELELSDTVKTAGDYWYSVSVEAESVYGDPPALLHSSPIYVKRK